MRAAGLGCAGVTSGGLLGCAVLFAEAQEDEHSLTYLSLNLCGNCWLGRCCTPVCLFFFTFRIADSKSLLLTGYVVAAVNTYKAGTLLHSCYAARKKLNTQRGGVTRTLPALKSLQYAIS